ncbi:MAG: alpha/beta fold hydrolase [Actinobacteria bacterium]|nr:alpha/beta fold hydrolase [Actinomycetota bacterium]
MSGPSRDLASGLAHEWHGEGEEVVVLAVGLGDDGSVWRPLLPHLAGFRVLTFDNRGVGATTLPLGGYSTRLLAADLATLTEALGIDDFHLVGTSMAGMMAQWFAIEHGERLLSLTLANTYASISTYCRACFASAREIAYGLGVGVALRDSALLALSPAFFAEQPEQALALLAGVEAIPQSIESFEAQLTAVEEHDARGRLGQVGTPTMVLVGREDRSIPPADSRLLLDELPDALWVEVRGGHYPWLEDAGGFAAELLSFWSETKAARDDSSQIVDVDGEA